jgi:hypothetical protein
MTNNQLIKNNQVDLLRKSIRYIDIHELTQLCKASISYARYDCFYVLYDNSKRFFNFKEYYEDFISEILQQLSNYNKIDLFLFVFKDKSLNINKECLKPMLSNCIKNIRVFNVVTKEYNLSNEDFYFILSKYLCIECNNDAIQLFYKKIDLIMSNFKYNSNEFYHYLKKNDLFHMLAYKKGLYYSNVNFFDFINRYDEYNVFYSKYKDYEKHLEDYQIKDCLKIYKQYLLTKKIELF